MPYTTELDISAASAEIDKFKAIVDEASITPTSLGNLLYQILRSMKPAAKAFGIPPQIPYADTLAVTHETDKVKVSYNYRNPDGSDGFKPVWIEAATDEVAGAMRASDKRLLDHVSILAQNMDRNDDFQLADMLMNWFENLKAHPHDVIYDINVACGPDIVSIDYDSNGVLVPDQEPDYLSVDIPAATLKKAGVMAASDKQQLSGVVQRVSRILHEARSNELDDLMTQGQYLLSDGSIGSMLTVAVTKDPSFSITQTSYTITQVLIGQADIQVRSRVRTVKTSDGSLITLGDWSEWRGLKKVLDKWTDIVDAAADVAHMKSVFEQNGWW